jgi:hypothetical protein
VWRRPRRPTRPPPLRCRRRTRSSRISRHRAGVGFGRRASSSGSALWNSNLIPLPHPSEACRHPVVPDDGTVGHPSTHHHSDMVITCGPVSAPLQVGASGLRSHPIITFYQPDRRGPVARPLHTSCDVGDDPNSSTLRDRLTTPGGPAPSPGGERDRTRAAPSFGRTPGKTPPQAGRQRPPPVPVERQGAW